MGGIRREGSENKLTALIPFLEVAMQMKKDYGINVQEDLLASATQAGLSILEEKQQGNEGYEEMGKRRFDNFMARYRMRLTSNDALPYMVAFAGGVTANEAPMNVAVMTRNWLAQQIPGNRQEAKNAADGITTVIHSRLKKESGFNAALRFASAPGITLGELRLN